jgi:hypothetical protein
MTDQARSLPDPHLVEGMFWPTMIRAAVPAGLA